MLLSREGIKWAPESELKSTKLLTPWLGPFQISKIDTNYSNITLKLPPTMKCHPTFHVKVVKPYLIPNQQFPHWIVPTNSPPEVNKDGFDEFEVENILDHKFDKNHRSQFLIRWKGYDEAHDTWEPESNLKNASKLLKDYKNTYQVSSIVTNARGGVEILPVNSYYSLSILTS